MKIRRGINTLPLRELNHQTESWISFSRVVVCSMCDLYALHETSAQVFITWDQGWIAVIDRQKHLNWICIPHLTSLQTLQRHNWSPNLNLKPPRARGWTQKEEGASIFSLTNFDSRHKWRLNCKNRSNRLRTYRRNLRVFTTLNLQQTYTNSAWKSC